MSDVVYPIETLEGVMGTIRNRVSELMGRERMKITDLMHLTGLSYGTAWALYHDKTNGIDYDTLSKLCEVFGAQPGDLLVYISDTKIEEKNASNNGDTQ